VLLTFKMSKLVFLAAFASIVLGNPVKLNNQEKISSTVTLSPEGSPSSPFSTVVPCGQEQCTVTDRSQPYTFGKTIVQGPVTSTYLPSAGSYYVDNTAIVVSAATVVTYHPQETSFFVSSLDQLPFGSNPEAVQDERRAVVQRSDQGQTITQVIKFVCSKGVCKSHTETHISYVVKSITRYHEKVVIKEHVKSNGIVTIGGKQNVHITIRVTNAPTTVTHTATVTKTSTKTTITTKTVSGKT